jgi:hypothetical protein
MKLRDKVSFPDILVSIGRVRVIDTRFRSTIGCNVVFVETHYGLLKFRETELVVFESAPEYTTIRSSL